MTESTVTDVKLKDGNRLIHVRAGLPVAFISVWFDVGARHDPPGKEGLAHLVEHLFMKTTPRFPREELMLNHLASQGLRYNATTSMHRMFFRYRCDDARTVSAIPDFLETLATSRVNEEMFRTEKEVIKDERAMRYSQPARRLYELSKQGLYPNHALSRSVLGSEESVATITMEDVNGFLDARIRNAPPIFVVVSDESTESIIASFGDYTSAATAETRPPLPQTAKIMASPLPRVVRKDNLKHVEVSLNFLTCPSSLVDDVRAIGLLCQSYLAGTVSSRLGLRLRVEKRLTYGVHAEVEHASDTGYAMFRFSCPPDRVDEALAACDEELAKVRSGEFNAAALAAAKEDRALAILERALDPETIASRYARQALAGLPLTSHSDEAETTRRLTADDLTRVARTYITDANRSVAVLGPINHD